MSDPIRVLELRSVWGTGGGPDKTILNGARLHDPARVAVTVCYIRDARDRVFALDRRAADLGIDYVEVTEKHSFDPGVWPQLRKLVRERHIDVVHAHDHKTDALTWALAKREPIVPLSTAHGFAGESWNERIYYAIEKRLLARFPRVIAVANHIKAELVRTGSRPERVVVINNAIDPGLFHRDPTRVAEIRASLGFAPKEFVIGAVGRLEAEKRFDLLLEAFAAVGKRFPHARLAIVGEGSCRAPLEAQIASLNLGSSVTLLGHRTDVVALYHAFDLFVQSSEREGTPNCVLEAMSMEVPILATAVGGTSELMSHDQHGTLIPRHDVPALIAGLEQGIADPQRARRLAVAARARVETELSFARRMQRLEEIYLELGSRRVARDRSGVVRPA